MKRNIFIFLCFFSALCVSFQAFAVSGAVAKKTEAVLTSPMKFAFPTDHLGGEDRPLAGESYPGYTKEEALVLHDQIADAPSYADWQKQIFEKEEAAFIVDALDPGVDTGLIMVVHTSTGTPLFVDLGPGGSAKGIIPALLKNGLVADSKVKLLLTHPHFDHYGIFEAVFGLYDVEKFYYLPFLYKDPLRWVHFQKAALLEAGGMSKQTEKFLGEYAQVFEKMTQLRKAGDREGAQKLYDDYAYTKEFSAAAQVMQDEFLAKAAEPTSLGKAIAMGDPQVSITPIFYDKEASNPNNASAILYTKVNTDQGIVRGLLTGDGEGTDTSGRRWDSTSLEYNYRHSAEYNVLLYFIDQEPSIFAKDAGLDFFQAPHHGSRNGAFNLFLHERFTTKADRQKILDNILDDLAALWKSQGVSADEIKKRLADRQKLDLKNLFKSDGSTITFLASGDTSYSGTQHPYYDVVANYQGATKLHLLERYPEPFEFTRTGDQAERLAVEAPKADADKLAKLTFGLHNETPQGTAKPELLFNASNSYEAGQINKYIDRYIADREPPANDMLAKITDEVIAISIETNGDDFKRAMALRKRFDKTYFPYGTDAKALEAVKIVRRQWGTACNNVQSCLSNQSLRKQMVSFLIELNAANALSRFITSLRSLVVSKCRYEEKKEQINFRFVIHKNGTVSPVGGFPLKPGIDPATVLPRKARTRAASPLIEESTFLRIGDIMP